MVDSMTAMSLIHEHFTLPLSISIPYYLIQTYPFAPCLLCWKLVTLVATTGMSK